MSGKNLLKYILSLLMVVVFLSVDILASAALLTFETQYDYDSANLAWLTDLVIKEDMKTVDGMAQRTDLVAVPDYPYTETPESFSEDVNYFTSLYNLEEGSQRAGYIYFFEVLNAQSELIAGDVSDADIKEYLEGIGVKYPAEMGSDELVIARALFTALVTGNVNGNLIVSGSNLEEIVVSYISDLTGMNIEELKGWMPDSSVFDLDEYILAASKLTLWSNGYDVTPDTPADEVYRLVAAMTVKSLGLSVDSALSFEELNVKYIAALLSQKYSVSVDSVKLGEAIENESVAFYILQLMGKNNGLSIREDNSSYNDAFYLVAENSDIFDIEIGEFYADIPLYDVYLQRRCSSIWMYPTAYSTNRDGCNVVITVNGLAIKNNYYNEVPVDPDVETQEFVIKVTAIEKGETYTFTYTVRLHQGTYAPIEGDKPVSGESGNEFASSDSIVLDILSSLGVNIDVSEILNGVFETVPEEITDIVSFIAPTFGQTSGLTNVQTGEENDEEFYLGLLDEIGAQSDCEINGIPEIDVLKDFADGGYGFISFGE